MGSCGGSRQVWTQVDHWNRISTDMQSLGIQDKNESYFLLNNLLSLNTELENDSIPYESSHRRGDGAAGRGEIFNMDWLDSLEFKEENQENEESGYPEKDSERKRKHNQVEKARRLFIDAKIRELGTLLPSREEMVHELAKDIKYNKGGILAATVSYLKMLKMDQIRKNHLEEEVRAQALQNRKLLNKIQEYEKEMKSYGITVDEWSVEEITTFDEFSPSNLGGKIESVGLAKTPRSFEQLDMDYDSMDSTPNGDPMISSAGLKVSPASSTSSRGSSIESVDDELEPRPAVETTGSKWKGSYERRRQTARPRPESYSPRIPVVSRPYLGRNRTTVETNAAAAVVFPLPSALQDLGDSWQLQRKRSEWVGEQSEGLGVIRAGPGLSPQGLSPDLDSDQGPPRKVILQGRP